MKFLLCFHIISSICHRKSITSKQLLDDKSYYGLWKIKNYNSESKIIHLSSNGRIITPPNILKGIWYRKNSELNMIFFNNNSGIDTLYNGFDKEFKIIGNISYGNESPDYMGNFTMEPVFYSLHKFIYQNKTHKKMIDYKNITGKWLFKNTYSDSMFLINIYENLTWDSNVNINNHSLGGLWNMYDSSKKLDLTSSIKIEGDYIWLLAKKLSKSYNRFFLNSDILYLGKIIQHTYQYYYSEEAPSNVNGEQKKIATKINGTILYGFELEPEISESFTLTRWWD